MGSEGMVEGPTLRLWSAIFDVRARQGWSVIFAKNIEDVKVGSGVASFSGEH